MLSYAKKRWYCLTSAFFGSVRIWTRSSFFSWCTAEITGRRPMNSGISPKLRRSSGMTCPSSSLASLEFFERTSAPKPTAFRSEEHTSELQSHSDLVCRLLLEKKNKKNKKHN